MNRKLVVLLFAGVFLISSAAAALAQQAESQLRLIGEVHVKPGLIPQYEAAIQEAVAFRTANKFPFPARMYVTEGFVYRLVTDLEGWEDMTTNDAWYQQFSSLPEFVSRLQEATDHTDRSFQRTRPELFVIPDNPRVPVGEAGFIHEIRVYLRTGTVGQAAEVLEKFSALYRQHDIPDVRIVWEQETGSDGPLFALYFLALDAADYYTYRQKNVEMMGDHYQALVGQLAEVDPEIWTAA